MGEVDSIHSEHMAPCSRKHVHLPHQPCCHVRRALFAEGLDAVLFCRGKTIASIQTYHSKLTDFVLSRLGGSVSISRQRTIQKTWRPAQLLSSLCPHCHLTGIKSPRPFLKFTNHLSPRVIKCTQIATQEIRSQNLPGLELGVQEITRRTLQAKTLLVPE